MSAARCPEALHPRSALIGTLLKVTVSAAQRALSDDLQLSAASYDVVRPDNLLIAARYKLVESYVTGNWCNITAAEDPGKPVYRWRRYIVGGILVSRTMY